MDPVVGAEKRVAAVLLLRAIERYRGVDARLADLIEPLGEVFRLPAMLAGELERVAVAARLRERRRQIWRRVQRVEDPLVAQLGRRQVAILTDESRKDRRLPVL